MGKCAEVGAEVRCGGTLVWRIDGVSTLKLGRKCAAVGAGGGRVRSVCLLEGI